MAPNVTANEAYSKHKKGVSGQISVCKRTDLAVFAHVSRAPIGFGAILKHKFTDQNRNQGDKEGFGGSCHLRGQK
jgi:hypothetical protein